MKLILQCFLLNIHLVFNLICHFLRLTLKITFKVSISGIRDRCVKTIPYLRSSVEPETALIVDTSIFVWFWCQKMSNKIINVVKIYSVNEFINPHLICRISLIAVLLHASDKNLTQSL